MDTVKKTTKPPTTPTKIPQPLGVVKEAINKQTKDLYLAAALKCEGCKFLEINKEDRTRMIFVFEGGELADRVEREWYEETLVVSAYHYAASLRSCKSLIHQI